MMRILTFAINLMLIALISMGSGMLPVAASDGPALDLFSDASSAGSPDIAGNEKYLRARYAAIGFDLLDPQAPKPGSWLRKGDRLALNLFEDTSFTAVLDEIHTYSPGSYVWVGHLEGDDYSNVSLSVVDGVMIGNIVFLGGFYTVRFEGNGQHIISQRDPAAFPPEVEPIEDITPNDEPYMDAPAEMDDDGARIDVLVVFTPLARTAAGGDAAMKGLINLAVAETNTSYRNSGIVQRLRLVHKQMIGYSESAFDWGLTLARLKSKSDGNMDYVHTLRDLFKADAVVLIVANTGYCGLAYMMNPVSSSFENRAFSVVSEDCATGNYSFGHELGHNMSARHDRYVDNQDGAPFNFNHGYVHTGSTIPTRWRTVMAYITKCNDLGYFCPRIQKWSNPKIDHNEAPTGTPNDNNKKTLNQTAYTVANFRKSGDGHAFSTHFANKKDWTVHKGDWKIKDGTYLFTKGKPGKWSSVSYNAKYSTLTYKVKMKRKGCDTCSNSILIRGKPTLDSGGKWEHYYAFQYSNNGYFAVKRRTNFTTPFVVKDWTLTPAINKGGWNTLKVRADGSFMRYYINGVQVWLGWIEGLGQGKVGISMYKKDTTNVNKLWVDYAKLKTTEPYGALDILVPGVEVPGGTVDLSP